MPCGTSSAGSNYREDIKALKMAVSKVIEALQTASIPVPGDPQHEALQAYKLVQEATALLDQVDNGLREEKP